MTGILVSKLTTDGRGLAFIDGKATFIAGALPNEVVTLRYLKRKRQYDEAEVVDILQASPERVVPKCEVFGICGGCSLQHLAPAAQIHNKELWLKEMLTQVGLSAQSWLAPLQADVWEYRHKARLGVRFVRKKEKVLVGFRERLSSFLTDTERCEILHSEVGEHIYVLKALLSTLSIKEHIAQIEVAVADQGVALVLRNLVPMPTADLEKIIAVASQHPWIIYLQPGGYDTIQQVYPQAPIILSYQLHLTATMTSSRGNRVSDLARDPVLKNPYSLKLHFRPQDFTQINQGLNQLMVPQALELLELKKTDKVLDLFCGLGNFTLPLALLSQEVLGVEGDVAMTTLAEENARANGIGHTRFRMANLFESTEFAAFAGKVDKLLLDPPRAGAEAVVRHMHLWNPARIVYVSCHPATLVRDIEILVKEQGYQLEKIGVMDMFPHTNHVESMALLTKVC